MNDSRFSKSMRKMQERFGTLQLADAMSEFVFSEVFKEGDIQLIENSNFLLLASVDKDGQPQCSYKGGPRGFVRITGPAEISFPLYEGNGMYFSAGNMAETSKVGMLFIDFENQTRLRVNGLAHIDDDHEMLSDVKAAQLIVRVSVSDIHPNCSRNIHKMTLVEPSKFSPRHDGDEVGKAPWVEPFRDVLPDYMKSDDRK
jgi:uncharacterized protein